MSKLIAVTPHADEHHGCTRILTDTMSAEQIVHELEEAYFECLHEHGGCRGVFLHPTALNQLHIRTYRDGDAMRFGEWSALEERRRELNLVTDRTLLPEIIQALPPLTPMEIE